MSLIHLRTTHCSLKSTLCENLILRTSTKGDSVGEIFFGCSNYPICKRLISLNFDDKLMTSDQEKLANAFGLFVRTNSFIEATYGVVFFNLRQASFMDYLLRSDIVIDRFGIEIGLTSENITHYKSTRSIGNPVKSWVLCYVRFLSFLTETMDNHP
jgi:hypothetical protein